MIEVITTAESMAQAEELLAAGVDTLYIGEEEYGLRLPHSFTRTEQKQLIESAHAKGKKVNIAVNGIMHPDKMKKIPEYLDFLAEVKPDNIVVGDTGVIFLLQNYDLSYIYDAETLVTNARQINFWHKKGAVGAVLAREVPFEEMKILKQHVEVPTEVLVYGATCIHQSKRPLLNNYFNYTKQTEESSKDRGLFISEPKKAETHYSIYEDQHGTHIFADNDVNLINEVDELAQTGYQTWKLDGLFTPGNQFVEVAKAFISAKLALETGTWDEKAQLAAQQLIQKNHPVERGMDTGFYHLDPNAIK